MAPAAHLTLTLGLVLIVLILLVAIVLLRDRLAKERERVFYYRYPTLWGKLNSAQHKFEFGRQEQLRVDREDAKVAHMVSQAYIADASATT